MLKLIWRTLFCCFALVVGWSVFQCIIRPGDAFSWDEAAHSLKGLLIASDLKSGDCLGFLYDTYRQVYWPPLHSWLVGIAFLACEPNMIVARTVTLILFVLSACFIYLAALQFGQRDREAAAAIATTLFLTAPLIVLFSGQAMLEVPGVFFISLTVFVYVWLNAKPRSDMAHTWLGVAILCAYFARTNYGILLILVWAASTLLGGGMRALLTRSTFYTVLPLVIAFAIWFAYPPKIRSTLAALVNMPWGMEEPYSLAGFLYYPNIILHFFGTIWQSIVPVIAVAVGFKYWRNAGIRFLILLILIQLGFGLVHHQRVERHMCPLAPALVLITGFVFAEHWRIQGSGVRRWVPRILAVILCLVGLFRLPTVLHPIGVPPHPEVVNAVAAAIGESSSSMLLSTREIRNPCPPLLDWQLSVEKGLLKVTQSGTTMVVEEDRKIWGLIENWPLPGGLKNDLHRVMTRAEQPAKTRSLYLGIAPEAAYSNDPEKARAFLRGMDAANSFDTIVVTTAIMPDSLYPFDFCDEAVRSMGFQHLSSQRFDGNEIRFDLYRRTR
jgi:hypothetical protein